MQGVALALGQLPARPRGVVVSERSVRKRAGSQHVWHSETGLVVLQGISQRAQPGTRPLCTAGGCQDFEENILLVENSKMETIWAFHLGRVASDSTWLEGSVPDGLAVWETSEF